MYMFLLKSTFRFAFVGSHGVSIVSAFTPFAVGCDLSHSDAQFLSPIARSVLAKCQPLLCRSALPRYMRRLD